MDDRSFDRLARLLGEARDRRTGLKALVGGILGAGGLAALEPDADAKRRGKDQDKSRKRPGPEADRKKRRKRCKPACDAGFTCVKGACVCQTGIACGEACCSLGQSCVDGACRSAACDPVCENGYVCEGMACVCPSGIECGGACCASGQTCQDGTCAGQPDPDTCITFGQSCVDSGRVCCAGLVCGSGQGGEADVACYVPEGGACQRTAQCVFGAECRDGACQPPLPPPPPPPTPVDGAGAPCDPATTVCTAPGTACVPFSGGDRPAGTYCLRPAGGTCATGEQCATGRCGYSEASAADAATASATCCGAEGQACGSDADCCLGTTCSGGTCQAGTCDVCPSGCAYATIQEAAYDVARFPAGSTIRIAPGSYFNTVGVLFPWNSSTPPIANATKPTGYDRNLSFRRCGTEGRVRISTTRRILETVDYNPVPITRMAFAGLDFYGQQTLMSVAAPDDASRITVEMTDCRVSNFLTGTDEPVLIKTFGDLVMAGCTFRDNNNGSYGALRIEGDGNDPVLGKSTLLARDCLFTGNGGDEGAAIKLTNGGLGELRNCVLRENTVKRDGGAIYTTSGGKAVVIDCLLENNSAGSDNSYGGGAIGVSAGGPDYDPYPGGALSLQGSTRIVGNTALGSSGANGGGLMVKGADASARITVAATVTIADNITTQCVLVGRRDPQGGSPAFITDCQNWCAPDGYRVADTNDTETTPPAACATGCCSGACASYDQYGSRYWYCDDGN